jgi:hypothetical protein
MNKRTSSSIIIALIITILAGVAMYFIPLPGSVTDTYPDALTETSYGFPLVFKTVQTGGIAANLPSISNVTYASFALNLVIVAVVSFGISILILNIATRSHKK